MTSSNGKQYIQAEPNRAEDSGFREEAPKQERKYRYHLGHHTNWGIKGPVLRSYTRPPTGLLSHELLRLERAARKRGYSPRKPGATPRAPGGIQIISTLVMG